MELKLKENVPADPTIITANCKNQAFTLQIHAETNVDLRNECCCGVQLIIPTSRFSKNIPIKSIRNNHECIIVHVKPDDSMKSKKSLQLKKKSQNTSPSTGRS